MSYPFNRISQNPTNNEGNFGPSNGGLSQFFSGSQNDYFNNVERKVYPEYSEPNEYELSDHPTSSKSYMRTGPHFIKKSQYGTKGAASWPNRKPQRPFPYTRPEKRDLKNAGSFETEEESANQIPLPESKYVRPRNTGLGGHNIQYRNKFQEANVSSFTVSTQNNQIKPVDGASFRHFTGSVDHIVRWHRMVKSQDLNITYEASGALESMITQGCKQLLFIRGESGHVMQVVFYTIDRQLPEFKAGSIVMATGRMVGGNKLQAFDAVEVTKEEHQSAERLWFLCQRSLEALI